MKAIPALAAGLAAVGLAIVLAGPASADDSSSSPSGTAPAVTLSPVNPNPPLRSIPITPVRPPSTPGATQSHDPIGNPPLGGLPAPTPVRHRPAPISSAAATPTRQGTSQHHVRRPAHRPTGSHATPAQLANTGSHTARILVVAVVMLLAGFALLVLGRRRPMREMAWDEPTTQPTIRLRVHDVDWPAWAFGILPVAALLTISIVALYS